MSVTGHRDLTGSGVRIQLDTKRLQCFVADQRIFVQIVTHIFVHVQVAIRINDNPSFT